MATAAPVLFSSSADDLLQATLAVSLTAINLLRPVLGPAAELIDFSLEYINPAGQRMVGLPEQPAGTLCTLFPHAQPTGLLNFYRRVFETGEAGNFEFSYQEDELTNFYLVAARRSGELLVVSLTDSSNHERPAVEHALRASQAREQAARQAAERERSVLEAVLAQAPVAIGLFWGEETVVAAANARLCAMWGRTPAQVLGRPLLDGVPALRGQGFTELIAEVARTRQPYVGLEVPVQLAPQSGLPTSYFSFVYQPLYDVAGELLGVLDIALDVTEQVAARQQVQTLNEELAVANEELQAANGELVLSNEELVHTQLELRLLNQALEQRVAERTQALALAQAGAERQRLRLALFFKQAPAAICILDGADFTYELVNEAYQRLFPGRRLLGRPLLEALPELASQPFWHTLQRVYQTGETHEGTGIRTLVARHEDSPPEDFYFHYVQQARYDEQGRLDGVLVFVLDMTEQVRAQQRATALQAAVLAAAQQQARQREDLSRLFEQAPVAIVIFQGPDYVLDVVNPLASQLWGRTPAQVVGRPLHEALPEAQGRVLRRVLDDVVLRGEALVAQEVAAQLERANQLTTIYLNFVYQPLRDAEGRITGVAAVATEVSEQVAARQQVARANAQLHATNAELDVANQQLIRTNIDLDNFIYTASHDLRAPITNIEGLLTALQEQLPASLRQSEQVQPLLRMMQGAVERFQKTIAHLTDVSKLQQATEPATEAVDLATLVEDVHLDLAPELAATHARLLVDVAALPALAFSPKNLRSILYNLLSNAIKYRAPGRAPVVQLRGYATSTQAVLEVEDNGLGLDTSQQRRLFGMFQRLHSHVEGTGIGLYMVKKIVDNAGGSITVRSELGVGSTFVVALPAGPAAG